MKRIAPPDYGHKFDDVIEWLNWLSDAMTKHSAGLPIPGAITRLNEARRHEHTITFDANAFNWASAKKEDIKQTMKWIPAYEAYLDLVGVLEGWKQLTPDEYREAVNNIHACRDHLKKNNPPSKNPIKY